MAFLLLQRQAAMNVASSYLESGSNSVKNANNDGSFWIFLFGIILVCFFFFLYNKFIKNTTSTEKKK